MTVVTMTRPFSRITKETASTYKINDPSRRLTTVNTSSKLLAIPRENAFTRKLIQTALEKQIDRAN